MDKMKTCAQHADIDRRAGQPGDVSWWQREMLKKFEAGGGLDSDVLSQPYFSSMPLPYPQHLWPQALFQQFAHPVMPQSSAPMHKQEKEHDCQESGAERSPLSKAKPSHNCEASGLSGDTWCHSCHNSAGDSNLNGFYNMGGTRLPPLTHPGGFMFPMSPHPGQLDPLMLWMQYMRRQAMYAQSIADHRNGHQSPLPVPNQRGFIKVPSGIPQKQTQLWETQSSENVQLWATVTQLCATLARAEAEIFCLRGKISKLEDDLEMMKTRQTALSEALKGRTISSQTKREKRKRTVAVPVAILGLPASQPCPLRAKIKKARGIMNEGVLLNHANELPSGINTVCTHQNSPELTNQATQNGNVDCSMIIDLTERESRTDTDDKDHIHAQQLAQSLGVDNIISASRKQNESISIGLNLSSELMTEQECIIEPPTNAAERSMAGAESHSKQALGSADFHRDGGIIACNATEIEAQWRADAADGAGVRGEQINNLADMVEHRHGVLENSGVDDATALGDGEVEAMNACSLDGFDGPNEWTEGVMEA